MPECRTCHGERYEEYEEDGRMVRDACYRCGNTGVVSEEEDFRDRLAGVASVFAYADETAWRKACDEEPDGDGYSLRAAEEMLSTWDYFRSRVWGRTEDILQELLELPIPDQELLVAWNAEPYIRSAYAPEPPPKPAPVARPTTDESDDIPF